MADSDRKGTTDRCSYRVLCDKWNTRADSIRNTFYPDYKNDGTSVYPKETSCKQVHDYTIGSTY